MIDLPFLRPSARQLVGLDISSSSVKLVELSAGEKDAYKVERYAVETLPRDAVVDGNIANLDAVADDLSAGALVVLDNERIRIRSLPFRPEN